MAFFDERYIKNELLTKYHKIPSNLGNDEPCYAISSDWWLSFKYILDATLINPEDLAGHPGPINNLSLLKVDEDLKKSMLKQLCGDGQSDSKLDELCDWNRMKLKPKLSYGEDFIIVSSKVWKFLHDLFGGGPEIQLFQESFDFSNVTDRLITVYKESALDIDYCVNTKLKKINVIVDKEVTKMTVFRVSLDVNAKVFLQSVCQKLKIPFIQSKFSWSNDDGASFISANISDYDTLARLGIRKNSTISISQERSEENQTSNLVNSQIKKAENNEGSNNQDDNDDNIISVFGDQTIMHQFLQGNQLWGNSEDPLGFRENDTSTKTDSTGLPNQNSVIIEDIPIDYEALENRLGGQRMDITTEKANQATITALHAKIQKVVSEEKIQLKYKPLKEIKKSLNKLQAQWLQQNHSKPANKF